MSDQRSLSSPEPMPIPVSSRPIWELVIEDMQDRDRMGREKYGTPLQAHNGRRPLVDAYQEVLDLAVYLRQSIEERGNAVAEADRLRNVCHALEQENRILREDVKGIIDRECDTLLADLADACRERDGLRDQLERRAARASEVVRMCYQTAQKLGIAGTPTILTEAGSVRWILTDLESRHGECAALAQELADVRAERDRLRTLDEGKE